jgi:hypothetical protein
VSIVQQMLDHVDEHDEEAQEIIKDLAGAVYLAGTDTTVAVVTSFFLAMLVHPEVQHRAQAELDAVVGRDRLPEFSDQTRLPYVKAVISECLRWLPVLPLGMFVLCPTGPSLSVSCLLSDLQASHMLLRMMTPIAGSSSQKAQSSFPRNGRYSTTRLPIPSLSYFLQNATSYARLEANGLLEMMCETHATFVLGSVGVSAPAYTSLSRICLRRSRLFCTRSIPNGPRTRTVLRLSQRWTWVAGC